MAQLNDTFSGALRTPAPDPSDSEGVLLALETAKVLEARGDTCEATRWLRRAATEAEKQGNDARVLEFAHAAADLTSTVRELPSAGPVPAVRRAEPSDSSAPTIRRPDIVEPVVAPSVSSEGTTEQLDSSRTTIPDEEASVPTKRSVRVGATRVAVRKAAGNAKSFSVERLDPGQRLPVGTMEAMLVFAEEADGPPESEADDLGESSTAKREAKAGKHI